MTLEVYSGPMSWVMRAGPWGGDLYSEVILDQVCGGTGAGYVGAGYGMWWRGRECGRGVGYVGTG